FRLVYYGVSPTPTHVAGLTWSNITYDIQAAVGIDTPAGHFEAYPIRETFADRSFMVSFFAPVAGNYARTEAHNGTATVGTADLVVRPRAEMHEVGFVVDQVRGDLRASQGPHRLGAMMAVQDHEVPLRHEDRPFQEAVPADAFRQLLQECGANPLVAMEPAEL